MKRTAPKVRLFDRPTAPHGVAVREPAWQRSPEHLAWVRTLPCACGCGLPAPSEAAHVRYGADGATQVKPSDFFAVPLNIYCHRVQHSMSEGAFWRDHGVPFPAEHAARQFALNSPCAATRKAAQRWFDTGHWSDRDAGKI